LWLADRLAVDGAITLAKAADALSVSEMTIRRDLAELEELGTARRVRGGARAVGPLPFAERRRVATRAKSRIAAKLSELVPSTGTIAFDASSTVMRAAAALGGARDLTVVSNGLDTFTALQGRAGVTALLTGGELDPRTGSLVGALACRSAAQLAVDVFVASAASVDVAGGARETTLEEAEVKRSMAANASTVVLAVDSSKLGQRAVAVSLEWEMVDLLVTELDPQDPQIDTYRDLIDVV
jgi:DeoR family fructose operon transcriptional repressor